MTTSVTETQLVSNSASRIWNVARLHLVNRSGIFGMPITVLGLIIVINLILAWTFVDFLPKFDSNGDSTSFNSKGAGIFIVIYMMVVAIQAINLTFPFAQGYSVTRRNYYLGTSLCFVLLSVIYAAILTTLTLIEQLTNGWWMRMNLFGLDYLGVSNPIAEFFCYFMTILFFFFLGVVTGSLYFRFKMWGLLGFFVGMALVIIACIVIPVMTNTVSQIGSWFVTTGTVGVIGWTFVPTLIAAICGYLILRRATPHN